MKIALVHDYLCDVGGSERIFQYICEEFSEADIYTLSFCEGKTFPYFEGKKIHTSFIAPLIKNTSIFRALFPISTYVMQWMDFSGYDIVISSSATVAKYIRAPSSKHVCYCYIPTRAIWQSERYFRTGLIKNIFNIFLPYLKKRDYNAAQYVDKFIAISNYTKNEIKKTYDKDADVIYCPINFDKYRISADKQDCYLIVSRLEKWKSLEHAIEAFNVNNKKLIIVGEGPLRKELEKCAKNNITFVGSVSDEELVNYYSKAKAVIFPTYLEYGLVPLEACASGTPVICYGKGGVLETMRPYDGIIDDATAVLYDEQTADSLNVAIIKFEGVQFDCDKLREYASSWDIPVFKSRLREVINNYYAEEIK